MMSRTSQVEFSARQAGEGRPSADIARRSWPGIRAETASFPGPVAYDFRLVNASNYLALHDIHRDDGETLLSGLPRSHLKDMRNRMTFVPAGCSVEGWSRMTQSAAYVAVYFDACGAENPLDLSQIPPLMGFEDHMLRSTMQQFQRLLRDPSLDLPGYAETLAALLAFELGRYTSQLKKSGARQGGLTTRQVRLITDYMDAHLTDKTTIAELSAQLNLSRFHFIRAFKRSAGMPPHQFILHRRVDRAKELLANGSLSVTEIAASTGFNSVTQLTRAFRRIVGTTPTAYRRDRD